MTAKISSSADGLKVTIGNAAEVALEIDQTAKTISGINGYSLGAPQTWQDMTASRDINTNYTNGTNQPIMISIRGSVSDAAGVLSLLVNGINIASLDTFAGLTGGLFAQLTAIIPVGTVYRLNSTAVSGFSMWAELR